MHDILWLLLPLAAACGWWWARYSFKTRPIQRRSSYSDYFKGLNYLLDDKPDQALEVLARVAETERDIVEAHLTLGNLFRRRGEVDRAIHIHHNLVQRQNLTTAQHQQALLELAEDYMKAGLFDRAEMIYHSIIEQTEQTEHTAVALHQLIQLYEQEKDWHQALSHCDLLEQMTGQVRKTAAAHYCCEIAEQLLTDDQIKQAINALQTALQRDSSCTRANLLKATIAIERKDYHAAIKALQKVPQQKPEFLLECIEPLKLCYQSNGQIDILIQYLLEQHQKYHNGRITAAVADLIMEYQGLTAALDFLEQQVQQKPSFIGLRRMVELKLERDGSNAQSDLRALYRTSRDMLDDAARYRCDNCGFILRTLNWHCPSCKEWDSIKPLGDMIARNEP